jgi:glycolate oxidase
MPPRRICSLWRELGGTVSGEHGVGKLKVGQLSAQSDDAAVGAHEAIKRALEPETLFNPGTKDPRPVTREPVGEPQAASR